LKYTSVTRDGRRFWFALYIGGSSKAQTLHLGGHFEVREKGGYTPRRNKESDGIRTRTWVHGHVIVLDLSRTRRPQLRVFDWFHQLFFVDIAARLLLCADSADGLLQITSISFQSDSCISPVLHCRLLTLSIRTETWIAFIHIYKVVQGTRM